MSQLLEQQKVIEAYPVKLPYPGAFHPNVERQIKEWIGDKQCVHLFSGASKIGNIRVDIDNPNATNNENVYDFCSRTHLFSVYFKDIVLLLDPVYEIQRKNLKLKPYGIKENLSGNVLAQKILLQHIQEVGYSEVILLDIGSPKIPGYSWDYRLVKYGGWKMNRTLNHYIKENTRL